MGLKATPDLHVLPYHAAGDGGWSFDILAYYLGPRSRGRMVLTSRDPAASPVIDLGLLSDPTQTTSARWFTASVSSSD